MKYIGQFHDGMHISDVYLCKKKQIALTKNGKEYGALTLQDKTGTVDAKIWDLGSPGVGNFETLDYVYTLSVMKLCDYFAAVYPRLNRDLLLTGALFHDIGKTRELSAFPENDYTDDGQLLGHIIIGTEMVSERIREIPRFPEKLAAELKHCILAHHGELEYGSPKKPALFEAVALSLADNADAKLETMNEIIAGAGDNNGWLGYNRLLESNVRKTTEF